MAADNVKTAFCLLSWVNEDISGQLLLEEQKIVLKAVPKAIPNDISKA